VFPAASDGERIGGVGRHSYFIPLSSSTPIRFTTSNGIHPKEGYIPRDGKDDH
jgi:hypothetical protein